MGAEDPREPAPGLPKKSKRAGTKSPAGSFLAELREVKAWNTPPVSSDAGGVFRLGGRVSELHPPKRVTDAPVDGSSAKCDRLCRFRRYRDLSPAVRR